MAENRLEWHDRVEDGSKGLMRKWKAEEEKKYPVATPEVLFGALTGAAITLAMASRFLCNARKGIVSQLRPGSGLKVGLAGGAASSGRDMGAVPNGSTVITIKRTLRVIANPPLLAPAPPMSMKFNYIGIVVVLGVGIWAATRSEEEFKKGSFAGILDGLVVDGEDIDDEDDDFADIIGQPNMRGGGAGAGGPEGGAGAGGEQGEETVAPPTKR